MTTVPAMKIKALAPWYGNNRELAQRVGAELGALAWCGVPFCGGCPELPEIKTRAGLAGDLHRHIINLARVVRDDALAEQMTDRLDAMLFHPDELAIAQRRCAGRNVASGGNLFGATLCDEPDVEWAASYFASCWMGRGGHAGKKTEFTQGLALRFTSSGGGSAKRFRSAVESVRAWTKALALWEFTRLDCFEFLQRVRDQLDHGLYVDAPWPDAGDEYEHPFVDKKQRQLASVLGGFKHCRVVIRYGDHPLIRELYPESKWTWVTQNSVNQQGAEVREVLIINGPSYTAGGGV